MKIRLIKTLAATFIILIISLIGVTGFTAYTLNSFASRTIAQFYRTATEQSENTSMALGQLASAIHGEESLRAEISASLKNMVEYASRSRQGFQIVEAYMLDDKGTILAHSDVGALAKDSGVEYKGEMYDAAFSRSRRSPTMYYSLETIAPPADPLEKLIYDFLKLVHKELVSSTFMISVSVYPLDAVVPLYSLHVVYDNHPGKDLPGRFRGMVEESVLRMLAFSGLVSLIIGLVVFSVSSQSKPYNSPPTQADAIDRPIELSEAADSEEFNEEEILEIPDDLSLGSEDLQEQSEEILSFELEDDTYTPDDSGRKRLSPLNREFAGSPRVVDAIPIKVTRPLS